MRKNQTAIHYYLFCLDEISHIPLIIESPAQVPCPRLSMSPSGYQNHLEFFAVKSACLMFKVALNNGHDPFSVNFVIENVLAYIIVPEISFVAGLPHALMPS